MDYKTGDKYFPLSDKNMYPLVKSTKGILYVKTTMLARLNVV